MFTVKMTRDDGFTDQEWDQELEAAYWWAKCWNDVGFQESVKSFTYPSTICHGSLWWKRCSTTQIPAYTYTYDLPAQILPRMLSGSESLKPEPDGVADVEVECASQKGVLGWTYPNTLKEWVSGWFIDESSIADLAGNRAHEYMHKLGYDHPFGRTWDREYSVPYAIGDLTTDWVSSNYAKGEWQMDAIKHGA